MKGERSAGNPHAAFDEGRHFGGVYSTFKAVDFSVSQNLERDSNQERFEWEQGRLGSAGSSTGRFQPLDQCLGNE